MNYDVERLKETQFEILDYVAEVCKDNKIDYYIFFGTLLGAVRHKGYIPWDDDLDIACERKDYERLVKILTENQEKEPRFFVQSIDTDPESPVLHTKIRRNNTECIEKFTVSQEQNKGIFIDIFPLDNYTASFKSELLSAAIRALYSLRGIKLTGKQQGGLRKILCSLLGVVSIESINKTIDRLFKRVGKKESEYLTCYICRYEAKNCFISKSWLKPEKKLPFEDRTYNAPCEAEKVLVSLYGEDYNVLPQESKRITHEYQSVKWFD